MLFIAQDCAASMSEHRLTRWKNCSRYFPWLFSIITQAIKLIFFFLLFWPVKIRNAVGREEIVIKILLHYFLQNFVNLYNMISILDMLIINKVRVFLISFWKAFIISQESKMRRIILKILKIVSILHLLKSFAMM